MKRTFLTLFISLLAFTVNAQSDTSVNKIYLAPDKAPEFPGGIKEFYTFLAKTIKYPSKSRNKGKEGRVVVSFIIEKDGRVSDSKILVSVADDIDKEAIRVVNLSPQWTPGMVDGRPVRTQFSLPVTFALPVKGSIFLN